jgi:hypothetical protein
MKFLVPAATVACALVTAINAVILYYSIMDMFA